MPYIPELKWKAMTRTVNQIKPANQFLRRLLYSSDVVELEVEDIELSTITAGREIAPFVESGSEAIMVGGTQHSFSTVKAPNIRIKRPMTPSQLLFGRQPGTPVHLQPGQTQRSAVRAHIARDLRHMSNMVDNAEEYLVAMALQGVISYSVNDEAVFTITIPRSSANNVTLSIFWDVGDGTARPLQDIHAVKEIMAEGPTSEGLVPTDAICGTEAAAALLEMVEAGHIKMLGLEGQNVTAGAMTFVSQFNSDGVIYLGMLGGVRFWQYGRTASLRGTTVNMIRPKYVEFISTSPNSARTLYYAAIPDLQIFRGGRLRGRRLSKSWMTEDPAQLLALLASRPLPWPGKPNATVSVKVVSG